MSATINTSEVNNAATVEAISELLQNTEDVRELAKSAREFFVNTGKQNRAAILDVDGTLVPITVEALSSLLAKDYAGLLQSGILTEVGKSVMKLDEKERENIRLMTEVLTASMELLAFAVTVNKPKQADTTAKASTKYSQESAYLSAVTKAVEAFQDAFDAQEESTVPPSGK